MGKEKYQKYVKELIRKSPIVDMGSIKRIIRHKKNTKQYHKQLVRNLILKGKIKRLTKGYYTIYSDPSLAVYCFKPAYLGLQDALSFHDLWEQEAIPIILTARKVRQGSRKILGKNVLIRRINQKYIFGFEYKKQGEIYLPYSDIEKTFIDMLYFNEVLSEEAVENLRKRINEKKIRSYLGIYPERFRKRVLSELS